ncbi:MAG: hypothetical protein ABI652_03240 [Acidobacteriota bacterium]
MADRQSAHAPRRPQFLAPAFLLPLLFVLSLPFVTTRFYASDEIEFFSWLRSAVFDHDARFENEYRYFYDSGVIRDPGFKETFIDGRNEAGNAQNFAPIGTAILWAPFYAIGHLVAVTTGAPANGLSAPYIASVAYASAVYALLGVALTIAVVRRVVPHALSAALLVWIGTPLVFYTYIAPGFSHACSAFAVSLFLWVWMHVRHRWTLRDAALLGAAGALMAMVREQDVFFVAGPAVDFGHWAFLRIRAAAATERRGNPAGHPSRSASSLRRIAAAAGVGTAVFLLVYAPQLIAYEALNGHAGPTEKVARKMNWASPHFFQVLFSPEHGLFLWTPLALIAVVGLLALVAGRVRGASADGRWLATMGLLMFGLQVYVSGSVESWTVAGSFGQRRFVAITPLLAIGLAATLTSAWSVRRMRTTSRAFCTAIIVLCVWWNLGLMAQFGLHTMNRQALSLRQNARATFVDLPVQGPAIVWRYLTDRSSLFGLPRH